MTPTEPDGDDITVYTIHVTLDPSSGVDDPDPADVTSLVRGRLVEDGRYIGSEQGWRLFCVITGQPVEPGAEQSPEPAPAGTVEYGIARRGELWRGPMAKSDALRFLREWEADGGRAGVFTLAQRTVTAWTGLEPTSPAPQATAATTTAGQ